MTRRQRKFLGTFGLLFYLTAYAFGAVYIAVTIVPEHKALELAFYVAAGLAWILPMKPALAWMERPDQP